MFNSFAFEYYVALVVFGFGVLCGVLYEFNLTILRMFKNRIIVKNILDFIFAGVFATLFFISLNYFNFGQFRLYLLIIFTLGVILEHKLMGKLFAKTTSVVYNIVVKLIAKFKTTRIAKILFK